jgi:CelD/BcsL family acetyltransferase involved in cellulose biosynthesis
MKNLEIKTYKSFSKELCEMWKNFESSSTNYFFQSFNWQKLWFDHQIKYNKKIENYTVVIFKNNEPIMVLPFNIDYNNHLKVLRWSGSPFSDYNAPLIRNDIEISKVEFLFIWETIISNNNFDCIFLENQPEKIINLNNPFFDFLKKKINNYFYFIKFNEKFEIKKKEFDNIKYQTNRLKKLGKLEFKIAKNKDEIKKVLNFIILNKSNQYDRTNAWNLLKIKSHRELFELSNLNLSENIDLSYLSLNDEIIAAQSGYQYKKRYYYLFPAYNYKYRKFSPGKVLLKNMIVNSKKNLFDYFDLTIGSENYKENFSNFKMASALFLYSKNLKGFIYIFFLRLKYFIKLILK